MNKFWDWVRNEEAGTAELIFNGPISEDTWFGDEITPALFRNELSKISGDLTVWINSPGGDVFAASQIYTIPTRIHLKRMSLIRTMESLEGVRQKISQLCHILLQIQWRI